jgi:hypothetical protein
MTSVFIKEVKFGNIHTYTKPDPTKPNKMLCHMKGKVEIRVMHFKPGNARSSTNHKKLGEI